MKPINEKCLKCALKFEGKMIDCMKPKCWDVRVCSRKRYHYRNLEANRVRQREYHRYLRYRADKCSLCGSVDRLECHHIIPQLQGGADDPSNVVTLCHACHTIIEAYKDMARSMLGSKDDREMLRKMGAECNGVRFHPDMGEGVDTTSEPGYSGTEATDGPNERTRV